MGGWKGTFQSVVGFDDCGWDSADVRRKLGHDADAGVLHGIRFMDGTPVPTGHVDLPSLKELRDANPSNEGVGQAVLHHMSAMSDSGEPGIQYELDKIESDECVMVQMASQFNLLEMADHWMTPEHGVAVYASDNTQGPWVCSRTIAGAMYRNYLMPVDGGLGQSSKEGRSINTTAELVAWLSHLSKDAGHGSISGIYMNGYLDFSDEDMRGLRWVMKQVSASEELWNEATGLLRVGIHRGAPLNGPDGVDPVHAGASVDLVMSAAFPLAYSRHRRTMENLDALATFSRLVLEATYEATIRLLCLQQEPTRLLLTSVGGGVFGNEEAWINDAIASALKRTCGLLGEHSVWLNHHGVSKAEDRIRALEREGITTGNREFL